MRPSFRSTSSLQRIRPRPEPLVPWAPAVEPAPASANSCGSRLASMPTPVSVTAISTKRLLTARAETATRPPVGVNLIALLSRLRSTVSMARRSAWAVRAPCATCTCSSISCVTACARTMSRLLAINACTSISFGSMVTRFICSRAHSNRPSHRPLALRAASALSWAKVRMRSGGALCARRSSAVAEVITAAREFLRSWEMMLNRRSLWRLRSSTRALVSRSAKVLPLRLRIITKTHTTVTKQLASPIPNGIAGTSTNEWMNCMPAVSSRRLAQPTQRRQNHAA